MDKLYDANTKVAIWWIKRDFRLNDNEALYQALESNNIVIPIFLFEKLLLNGPDWGHFHTEAIRGAAQSLSKNLQHFNSHLLIFESSPIEALQQINHKLTKHGLEINSVYSHKETGLNHTFERDKAFQAWCKNNSIEWHQYTNNGVIRGPIDRNYWEKRFVTYMSQDRLPFHKDKLSNSFPEALKHLLFENLHSADSNPSSSFCAAEYMSVSERSANTILKDFLNNRGRKYRGGISSMNIAPDACSRLSSQIAWGALSLRTVLQECDKRLNDVEADESPVSKRWRSSLGSFRSRLFWHSHFVQKLENQVDMEFYAVNKAYRDSLPYINPDVDNDEHDKRLAAWLNGQTGFPAIDAAMRYYQKYGWLNFRSRAMVTSFACNALRLPWQTVLYALSKLMIDYVPGIHVSQVQMQAGVTGINTIRVYSPQKQLHDHDPECSFVYRMIPELRSLKPVQILSLSSELSAANLTTSNGSKSTYAKQIIDFKQESRIMKDALYAVSKSQACRSESKKVFIKHGSRRRNFSSRTKAEKRSNKPKSSQLNLF